MCHPHLPSQTLPPTDSDPAEKRTAPPSGGGHSLTGEDNKLNVEKSRKEQIEQIGRLTGELEFSSECSYLRVTISDSNTIKASLISLICLNQIHLSRIYYY